jgi:Uma2 family endonuclease
MTAVLTPIDARAFPLQGDWAYEDYRRLPDDGWRYEVIEGVLHMTPAPKTRHQIILKRLALLFGSFLDQHPAGEFLFAPVDVLLPDDLGTPVQPDLIFLRRERLGLIGEDSVQGAPDLIVEILSPSNWITDRRDKHRIYAEAGVAEYWIVDPAAKTVEVFVLKDGGYELLGRFSPGDAARSEVLPGFQPAIADLF